MHLRLIGTGDDNFKNDSGSTSSSMLPIIGAAAGCAALAALVVGALLIRRHRRSPRKDAEGETKEHDGAEMTVI